MPHAQEVVVGDDDTVIAYVGPLYATRSPILTLLAD
jgi:hypothetical protein